MGYTHYFFQQRDVTVPEWDRICKRFNRLLQSLPSHSESAGGSYREYPLVLSDGWGEPNTQPSIDQEAITFNGMGGDPDMSHDTMILFRRREEAEGQGGSWFCKTSRKPYDLVVCGLLLIAWREAPLAWIVASDGDLPDWQPAQNWVNDCLQPGYAKVRQFDLPRAYTCKNCLAMVSTRSGAGGSFCKELQRPHEPPLWWHYRERIIPFDPWVDCRRY